ncbi:MAG: ATP-binding protein, partial [Porcipelethomonas sp.]
NLDAPQSNVPYDELSPLLSRIEKQNRDIHDYIDMLKAKQNEFETVTQNMSEGLIIMNLHNILSCNRSALRILGNENFDYSGKSILEFNHSKAFISAVESTLSGKANEVNLQIDSKNYLMISSPVFDNNVVTGAVILLIDTTEKSSREALRREFSANVSHELKTPLTTISGYAEIMKSGWADPKDYQMFAEKIYNEGKRLINLIDDIINLSKLDENSDVMEMEDVDLFLMAEDVVNTLSKKAADKNVEIKVSGEDAEIKAVPHLIYEMIFNLCDNAIKYNKKNGRVDITIVKNNDNSKLIVSDTGIGIPPEDTERVFERFYCVDKSHSKETGGTGLGLSIVKHGAILHNAKIDVDSVLGEGTTITLTFNK